MTLRAPLSNLDAEVMTPGQPGSLLVRELGAVAGTWTAVGGPTRTTRFAVTKAGDHLLIAWSAAQANTFIGHDWALRLDGRDVGEGEMRRRKPGAPLEDLTVSVDTGPVVVEATITLLVPGPPGPDNDTELAVDADVEFLEELANRPLPKQKDVNEATSAGLSYLFGGLTQVGGAAFEALGRANTLEGDVTSLTEHVDSQATADRAAATAAVDGEKTARLAEAATDRAASIARDGVERLARLAQGRPARTRWALVGGNFDDRGLYRLPYAAVGPITGGGFDLRAEAVAVSGPVGSDGEFLTQSHDGEFGDWDNFELWLRHELLGCRFEAEWTQQGGTDERASLTSSRLFRYGEVPPTVRFTLDFATGRATFWFETFDQAAVDVTTVDGRLWDRDTFITVGATDIDPTCTADWLVGFGNGEGQRRLAGLVEARHGIDGALAFTFDPDAATDDQTIPDPVSAATWSSIDDTRLVDTSPGAAALAASALAELTARVTALENP